MTVTIDHPVPGYDELAKQRVEGNNCDVTIIVGGKPIYGHKAVLSARLPYFRAVFNSNMKECASGKMKLCSDFCEFDFDTIENLLNYAYTGRLTISVTNIQNLVLGAAYLDIEPVLDECARFMRKRINIDNALPLLWFCKSIAFHKIDDQILRCIYKNFIPISRTPEFLEVSVDDLESFLQRDSLNVDNEEQVFEAVSRWIGEDVQKKKHAARLLKCVRCTRLSEKFISDKIELTKWVLSDPECAAIVNEAKEYITDKAKNRDRVSFRTDERICYDALRLIFFIECTSLNIPEFDSVVMAGQKLHFIGGKADYVYETITKKIVPTLRWLQTASRLNHICTCYSAIEKANFSYVAGGRRSLNRSATLQSYDPSSKVWTTLRLMTEVRSHPAYCVFDRKLYIFGGTGDYFHHFQSCEYYDPDTDSWTPIRPMKDGRTAAAAAVLNRQIYVVGGYDGDSDLDRLERYDPVSDTWTTLRSMTLKRAGCRLVTSCGKLFVSGGFLDFSDYIFSMEMYDPETDTWEEATTLSDLVVIYAFSMSIPASIASPASNLEASA